MAGYIKIHRKLLDWGWYSDPCVKVVFLHFLITANYKDTEYRGEIIKRGQTIFGLNSLSEKLGFSVKQIRRAIAKLSDTGEISTHTNHHFSIATINNYNEYQDDVFLPDEGKQRANKGQTEGKQRADRGQTKGNTIINKEIEEVNKEKESIKKEKYGTFKNVCLSADEVEKLKKSFPDYLERINRLSEYIESSGKKYMSHYAVILSWARKDKPKGGIYSTAGCSFDVSKYERTSMFDD